MKMLTYMTGVLLALVLSGIGLRLSTPGKMSNLAAIDSCGSPGQANWERVFGVSRLFFPEQKMAWETCCGYNPVEPARWWTVDGADPKTGEQCLRVSLDPVTGHILLVSRKSTSSHLPSLTDMASLPVRRAAPSLLIEKTGSWLARIDRASGSVAIHWRPEQASDTNASKLEQFNRILHWRGEGANGEVRRAHVCLDPFTCDVNWVTYYYIEKPAASLPHR